VKSVSKMTQGELGAFIQSQLREKGIEVILSGGAAVAIYSNNKYVSKDLDLVNIYGIHRRRIRDSMTAMGFMRKGGILDILTHSSWSNFPLVLWR
jgi:hypothetical protein